MYVERSTIVQQINIFFYVHTIYIYQVAEKIFWLVPHTAKNSLYVLCTKDSYLSYSSQIWSTDEGWCVIININNDQEEHSCCLLVIEIMHD